MQSLTLDPDPVLHEGFLRHFGKEPPAWELARPYFESATEYRHALRKALYFGMQVIAPLEKHGLRTDDAVLDLASGDGEMSLALSLGGYTNLTLYDLDPERITRAHAMVTALGSGVAPSMIQGDALELADGHDVLICFQTIEHLSDTGNYAIASRSCQRRFLALVNRHTRKLAYFHAPNYWYPIDGHDTGKPLFHFLPMRVRQALISRGIVRCSWSGISAPVSVGFLSRHLRDFRLATRYYAFADALDYLANRPPYDYMGEPCRPVDVDRLTWKKKLIVRASKILGRRSHTLLPSLSVIYARR